MRQEIECRWFLWDVTLGRTSEDQEEHDRKGGYTVISYYLADYHCGALGLNPVGDPKEPSKTISRSTYQRMLK